MVHEFFQPHTQEEKPVKSEAQLSCEAKGGRWDASKNFCILPKPEPITTEFPVRQVGEQIVTKEQEEQILRKRELRADKRLTPPSLLEVEKQEAELETERTRLLTEETPQRVELDPSRTFLETIPFLGGFTSAGISARRFVNKKLGFGEEIGINIGDVSNLPPELARDATIAAIQKTETDNVLTFNQVLGAYVEALPFGDTILGTSFAKTLEQPSANAEEVLSNIRKVKRQISNIEINVKTGDLPVETARDAIEQMELDMFTLEARLKNYINNSPSLKFNSDRVNTMETEILIVREKMLQAKLNILTGKAKEQSEIDLLLKIQSLDLGGDNE